MEKGDARKQPREVLHERRKQVIRMHRKGMPVMRIVEHSGLSWSAVSAAIAAYSMAAVAALKPAARGKKQGSGGLLSESRERAVRQIICDKRPEQLKMEFARWNRAAVMQLIERECGIKLSVRGVGNYLKRWGFTPQKPIKKAYEQRPEAVQAWLDEQCPEIDKRAKSEDADIHWGDETAVVNTDVRGRCYRPVGKTRWMIIDESFNSEKLIEFLQALIQDAGKKMFLILDHLRVHHSKPAKAWFEERIDKIELFYLPSYSPELNPEERLNADLNNVLYTKVPVRTKVKLKAATTERMQTLEKLPERVRKLFQDARVKYAA